MSERIATIRESLPDFFCVYSSWILFSIILCSLPILLSPIFTNLTITYSSLVAYCFTLLGAHVYLFDHHTESKGRRSPKSTLIKEVAIVLMFAAIAVFILYNTQDDFQVFINRNASGSIALTAILAFVPTFIIATPMLNREVRNSVDKRKVDKTWEDVDKVEKRYSEDEKELKGEAGLDVEDSANKQDQKGIK